MLTTRNVLVKFGRAGAAVGALVGGAANAAIDITPVTTEISSAAAPIAAIGAAVVLIAVGIKLFKWVKAAL